MKIKFILKGMLLYMTFLTCILTAMGIDSLNDKGYLTKTVFIIIGLIYWCKKVITKEEYDILTYKDK